MTFLTNWVFWAIVIVIVILLAIIGYLAEGTTLGPKNKKKQQQQNNPEKDVEEIKITEENNAPSAWTGEIKKDERHEQVHDVPSVDDWSTIPTDTMIPSIEEPLINENVQDNNVSEENQINPSILENLDAPLTDIPATNETKTQPEIAVQEPIVENIPVDMPKETAAISTLDTVPSAPELTVPEASMTVEQPVPTLDTVSPETIVPAVQEPVTENKTLEPSQNIEPAPIFDAPVLNAEPEKVENLEVPTEDKKTEENVEEVWK